MMKKRAEFTTKEAAKILKMSQRTVQFYTDMGLVVPEMANTHGTGTTRLYSEWNLAQLSIIRDMGKHGMRLSGIMKLARHIETLQGSPFSLIDYSI